MTYTIASHTKGVVIFLQKVYHTTPNWVNLWPWAFLPHWWAFSRLTNSCCSKTLFKESDFWRKTSKKLECSLLKLLPKCNCYHCLVTFVEFAAGVLERGPNPRRGNKTDNAHPPIHPTKYTDGLQVAATVSYFFFIVIFFLNLRQKRT